MQKFSDIVLLVNVPGGQARVPASAFVQINLSGGGGLATIYSDNGVTQRANPIHVDGSGQYYFYAADGVYDRTTSGPGMITETETEVIQLRDFTSGATSIGANHTKVIATGGQTAIPLPFGYVQGINAIGVYVNGLRMIVGVDYTETSTTVVTFTAPLLAGDEVDLYGGLEVASGFPSANVSFVQSGTATPRTANAKMADHLHIKDYGGVVDSSAAGAANVTAIDLAAAAAVSLGVREIWFDEGLYYFASKPATFTSGVTLVGRGKRTTYLVANYTRGSATTAFLEWDGSVVAADGGGTRNCVVYAGTGTTSGVGIKMTAASSTSRPGHMAFENGEITGDGTWAYDIYCDASGVTTSGSQGCRDVSFVNFDLFNATTKTMLLKNAINWRFLGLSTFTGSGSTPDITIDGGGASDSNSTGVHFASLNHQGGITVQNANEVTFAGARATNLTIESTGTNISYIGYLGNAPTNNSTQAHVIYTKSGVGAAVSGIFTALNGIKFGTGADALSEYDEFTFTPVLTFTTPGDVSVTYSAQVGRGVKIGKFVYVEFTISTSVFTHGSASGQCVITGLTHAAGAGTYYGVLGRFTGVALANYTQFNPLLVGGESKLYLAASAQGQTNTLLTTSHVASGGTPLFHGSICYESAA